MHNPNVSEEAKMRSRDIVEGKGTMLRGSDNSVDDNVLRGHKVAEKLLRLPT